MEPVIKKKKISRKSVLIICLPLSLIALVMALISMYVAPPEIPAADEQEERAVKYSRKMFPLMTLYEDAESSGSMPVLSGEPRKEGNYTFLIAGTSDGFTTDTIMVARLDTVGKTFNLVSIPRDTKVSTTRAVKKINGAHLQGGQEQLMREVGSILGFTPDFYTTVNLEGFMALVDAVGGVEFDVPHSMNYDDPNQNLSIHLSPGLQHLDGDKAMQLMRFRGYLGADFRRMEMQQEFLRAVAKKMITPATLLKIDELIEIYEDNVTTDLDSGNLLWLAMQIYGIGEENIDMSTFPVFTVDSKEINPLFYQFVSTKAALGMINEKLNPYSADITAANVIHPQS